MGSLRLNLVFHEINRFPHENESRFAVTEDFGLGLIKELLVFLESKGHIFLSIWLDDGFESQRSFAELAAKEFGVPISLAISTGLVGLPGYLSWNDLVELGKLTGISVCSHGVSHSALGAYQQGTVMPIQRGGVYQNVPKRSNALLSEEEIRYQLVESGNTLLRYGLTTSSFVYPHGIYNNQIVELIRESSLYSKAYTCDPGFETDKTCPFLIPRTVAYGNIAMVRLRAELETWLRFN